MKLKELYLENPVIPAPLSGYTDRAYREILRGFNSSITFPGLLPAEGLVRAPSCILEDIQIAGEPPPIGVQLFGKEPSTMAEAAQMLEEFSVKLIDVNLGCPMKKIVSTGCGASLLRNPALAVEIIRAIRDKISVPLTVKLRAGWDDRSINCVDLGKALEDAGADALCLHSRTREQLFHGKSDWSLIRTLKKNVSIPVIGNGDVFTVADAQRMMDETCCDAVMVGRGIIGNPWLIRNAYLYFTGKKRLDELPEISLDERIDVLLDHYRLSVRWRGERKGIVEMRKHFIKYIKGLPDARSLRQEVMTLTRLDQIEKCLLKLKNTIKAEKKSS